MEIQVHHVIGIFTSEWEPSVIDGVARDIVVATIDGVLTIQLINMSGTPEIVRLSSTTVGAATDAANLCVLKHFKLVDEKRPEPPELPQRGDLN